MKKIYLRLLVLPSVVLCSANAFAQDAAACGVIDTVYFNDASLCWKAHGTCITSFIVEQELDTGWIKIREIPVSMTNEYRFGPRFYQQGPNNFRIKINSSKNKPARMVRYYCNFCGLGANVADKTYKLMVEGKYKIYDASKVLMTEGYGYEIDIAAFPKGTYYVESNYSMEEFTKIIR